MPIYEYQCSLCGHQFDALQKMSDEPLKTCPSCNEPGLSKLVSAPAFKLNGTGWYETDFKGGKSSGNDSSDSSTSNSTDTKSASTTETTA